jgi:hypothetical protein
MDKPRTGRSVRKSGGRRAAQVAQLLAVASALGVSLGVAWADEPASGPQIGSAHDPKGADGQYTRKKLPGRMKSGTLTVTRAPPAAGDKGGSATVGQYTRRKLPGRMKSGTLANTGGLPASPPPAQPKNPK